jgi:NAD(P)-dependent dehydrogenase (short-subunit alcohol dehydrogenase family)
MAQRALTESMARHLGPSGIHVSLLILDGAIGGPEARARFRDRPDDAFIAPDAIASTALQLTLQDRSAWSFEVDLRPFNETW